MPKKKFKRKSVTGLILVLVILVLVGYFYYSGEFDKKIEKDPYSINCNRGEQGYYENKGSSDENFICASPKNCTFNTECTYLEINSTLPPRYGSCVSGTCHTFCGSGRIFECANT